MIIKRVHLIFPIIASMASSAMGQGLSFAEPVDISGGSVSGVSALDAADFNKDGLMDVVVMDGGKHADHSTFGWFEQEEGQKWTSRSFQFTEELEPFIGTVKCGDINGDSYPDVVFTADGHSSGPIKVYWLENPGKKQMKPWKAHLSATIDGFHANDIRLADMDNDGLLDIIIRHKNPNTIRIIFQNKKDEWSTVSINTEKLGLEGFAIGLINGDEKPDISVNGYWFESPDNPRKEPYLLHEIDPVFTTINPNTKEDIGDINQDGLNDIIISAAEAYYNGKDHVLAWYQAPKEPSEQPWIQHVVDAPFNRGHSVSLVDIDNDGDLDIVSGQAWEPRKIVVYLNQDASFETSYIISNKNGVYSGALVDVDGDGDIDIVGENMYSKNAKPYYYENLLK